MTPETEPPESRERGTAILVVTIVLFMILTFTLVLVNTSVIRSTASVENTQHMQLTADAEAGLGAKFDYILANNSQPAFVTETHNYTMASGHTVTITGTQVGATEVYELVSTAMGPDDPAGRLTVEIRAHVSAAFHPAFHKVLYVGNQHGFPVPVRLGPTQNLTVTSTFDESAQVNDDTRMSEADLGIDFNGDGDMNDDPRIRWLHGDSGSQYNGPYPGWGPTQSATNMEQTGGYYGDYRIDLDNDGTYGTYSHTVTNAPEFAAPTGTETPDPNWETNHNPDADYIEGNTYVNGNVEMKAYTEVFGNIDATGTIQGSVVPDPDHVMTENAPPLSPPDLHAEDYESIADQIITPSTTGAHPAFYSASGSGSFYGNLGSASSSDQNNGVVHLGPNSGGDLANFNQSDSGGLFLVKGNLWLHTSSSKFVKLPSSKALTLTIVVEGNMYIGDDLQYQNANSGVLFLVKGKTDDPNTPEREDETFLDTNKNYSYDPGEPLINDDGDGVYEGPREGQGNVYFGDAKYGTGGVTDGFMYAENNAYLMDPATASTPLSSFTDKDKIYGVKGFLSAGGVLDLGERVLGNDYFNYKAVYDERIEDGTLNFKGIPTSSASSNFNVRSWVMRHYRTP